MLNSSHTNQDVERVIHEEILDLLEDKETVPDAVHNEDALYADLDITSLDLAQLVSLLEMKFQIDPFEHARAITDIRTVGDLCHAYQSALAGAADSGAEDEALRASQVRAQARRTRRNA